MSTKKAISLKALREKQFDLLSFSGEWEAKMGTPERGFTAAFYGPSGSGKSTEVLRFCDYLAANFGKVLYNSWEEGISKSIQDTVVKFDLKSDRLYFYDGLTFHEMIDKAKKGRYAFVVVDSIQYMGFSYDQYKQFTRAMKGKSLILISQVNGKGKVRGGEQILHAADIKVNINAGKAEYRSRFRKGGHLKIDLFKPLQSQLQLQFNQS